MFDKVKDLFSKKKAPATGEKQYSKFGIGFRLITAFSVVTFLTMVISGLSWFSFDVLTKAQNETANNKVPAISLALKLANDTSQIAAIAPQLGAASSNEERQANTENLNKSIEVAQKRLEELNSYVDDNEVLTRVSENLAALAPLVAQLDGSVSERLRMATLRSDGLKQLGEFRKVLDKNSSPLLFPIRLKVFDTMDQWEELLYEVEEKASKGEKPEYDTGPLSQAITDGLTGQEAVFRVQASGYLLVSLLAEGALADNVKSVEALSTLFLSSISSMATPLSKVDKGDTKKNAAPLVKMFNDLLFLGSKGNDEEVIFKIRTKELQAIAKASDILAQSRVIAEKLSNDANSFVAEIEASVQEANVQNSQLADQTKITLAVVALIAIVVAIAIAWLYIARNIVRRLMMMVESARKLSEGDLDSSIYREGNDEIARLGFAIVGFRDAQREARTAREQEEANRVRRDEEKEQQRIAQAEAERKAQEEKERLAEEAEQSKREEMNKLANEFEGSVKHLVDSFSHATSNMTNLSSSMSNSAGETTALTQTVASASELSTNSINSVAAATEELTSSITEISRQVGQAASIAGEAVSEAERSNDMITSLSDAAAKIGDVVDLINDIAGQTNLLALNATIEAARAGDAGKGFAVVASEVKNLATQTAKATEEISSQIKSVQEETDNAVGAISGISATIGRINEIATTISAAVEEQGAATGEISRSVQQAADSAQEVTRNITTVNQTAASTGSSASEVQSVAQKLSQEAGDLDVEVQRFIQQVRAG